MTEADKDLKIQGLLQRITEITTKYENDLVDLRVAYTNVSNEADLMRQALAQLESDNDTVKGDTIVGNVVQHPQDGAYGGK